MKKLTKRVQADGLWFDVPADTASVMVNAFGQVLAISIGVVLSKGEHNWVIKHGIDDFVCPVGVVDLGGADWRECCWYVGDQFDGEDAERREWMARGVELPEKLPCDVRFEPGLIFRKGVLVQTMLDALIRRDDYEKELAELSEDERKARQEKISEFLNGLGE
ncbi:hypothetical protein [Tatumella sp. UCD-D_suzukii]|uniref:hypothetical protein n=1 Tax=Tatumella sp. UCD-D_suzukii TaxID=1408192 RepID=UPI000472A801|nr:hypothetical protein [Tatumella sp. UCD-D_suzukii]